MAAPWPFGQRQNHIASAVRHLDQRTMHTFEVPGRSARTRAAGSLSRRKVIGFDKSAAVTQ
jgi:hypothetical protein